MIVADDAEFDKDVDTRSDLVNVHVMTRSEFQQRVDDNELQVKAQIFLTITAINDGICSRTVCMEEDSRL